MSKIRATAWIRDGVLVERMHVNPCAFALSYLSLGEKISGLPLQASSLTDLVQFAFDTSGLSCSDKALAYARQKQIDLSEQSLLKLTETYNDIAARAALSCRYFPGAASLLQKLSQGGCKNFITSAVSQPVLDKWLETDLAIEISPYLYEVLGERPHMQKGEGHFRHIAEIVKGEPIYYIADAPLEIAQALPFHMSLGVETIGFANQIDNAKVQEGFQLALAAALNGNLEPDFFSAIKDLKPAQINLPDSRQSLQKAGAHHIVSAPADIIFAQLNALLS